ncbi:MAG: Nif3-like dinuclear metal center hexameric protein [Candidatus Aenigmatarchaeota archaeon]
MVKLSKVVSLLNKEIQIKNPKDAWCKNGLQVRGKEDVTKVGLSTDACMDVFRKASRSGCDLVITHHGLFQPKESKYDAKINAAKKRFLVSKKISLYSAHLPLDKNRKYGNNVLLCRLMGAEPKWVFDRVGYVGQLPNGKSIKELANRLRRSLKSKVNVYSFGKTRNIRKVTVCSGYGGGDVPEAIANKAEIYVTGEISHGVLVKIRDSKLSVITAGHYATETLGVKEIGRMLKEKLGLEVIFIDSPTGM